MTNMEMKDLKDILPPIYDSEPSSPISQLLFKKGLSKNIPYKLFKKNC